MRFWTLGCAASIGLAALLGACATTDNRDSTEQSITNVKAPVAAQVAVYRSVFASNSSALQGGAAAFCIGTGSGKNLADPDRGSLTALGDNAKVKPASACDTGQMGERVVDRQSRQPALLFGVETVSCTSADDCMIYGGYYEGNVSSQRNLYRVRRVNGQWNVTVEAQGPIS